MVKGFDLCVIATVCKRNGQEICEPQGVSASKCLGDISIQERPRKQGVSCIHQQIRWNQAPVSREERKGKQGWCKSSHGDFESEACPMSFGTSQTSQSNEDFSLGSYSEWKTIQNKTKVHEKMLMGFSIAHRSESWYECPSLPSRCFTAMQQKSMVHILNSIPGYSLHHNLKQGKLIVMATSKD